MNEVKIRENIVLVPISELHEYEQNAKEHSEKQIDILAKNIERFGFDVPIEIDKNNVIVAGHGRLYASKKLGLLRVPCIRLDDLTDDEIQARRLSDNQINALTGIKMSIAIEELKYLDSQGFDITLTGFDKDLLIEPDAQDDVIPENVPPVATSGEIWALGRHRVMCGDSTKAEDVEKLMEGKKADMVFTDPPYGVDYTGKTKDALKIENDINTNTFAEVMPNFIEATKIGGSFYVCCPAGNNFIDFIVPFAEYCHQSSTIIWVKNSLVMGHGDYHYKHEPILYGWNKNGKHKFYGDRTQTTVWEINRPSRSTEHPTMKPVDLITRAITNSSKEDDLILDLFGGSGSTLIAAEKTNRQCFMMEIDPKYVDVIIKRWEDYTHGKATKLN